MKAKKNRNKKDYKKWIAWGIEDRKDSMGYKERKKVKKIMKEM